MFIFAISFLVYRNSFHNEFVFDDIGQIVENKWIKDSNYIPKIFTSGVWSFREFSNDKGIYYRPIMHVMFMAEYHLFNLNPYGYHVVNFSIHFLNSSLFFIFLLLLFGKKLNNNIGEKISTEKYTLSFISALIFSLHPINSETVYWISAIPELTFSFFFILSLCFYIFSDKNKILLFASLISFFLSLLCKETAITLPLFLLVYNFLIFFKQEKRLSKRAIESFRNILPFILIALIYLLARILILETDPIIENYNRLATIIITLVSAVIIYIKNIIEIAVPINLSIFHSYELNNFTILYTAFIVALILVYSHLTFKKILKLKIDNVFIFGVLLFSIPLIPATNINFVNKFVLSERYLYLPSMGFSLIISFLISSFLNKFVHRKWATISLFFVICLLLTSFSAIVISQNSAWKDNLTLFSNATAKYPMSGFAHLMLAETYCKRGYVKECKDNYINYCELNPLFRQQTTTDCLNDYNYYYTLGNAYALKNDSNSAISQYKLALKSKIPSSKIYSEIYSELGLAYYQINDKENANKYLDMALKLNPESSIINNDLGIFHCDLGNYDQANYYFSRALKFGKQENEISSNKKDCIKFL